MALFISMPMKPMLRRLREILLSSVVLRSRRSWSLLAGKSSFLRKLGSGVNGVSTVEVVPLVWSRRSVK